MHSGVLLLDKPVGLSSTQALGKAKRLMGERKAGHTGTLDPFATGVLPLCFGEATKFSRFALDATKVYRATMQLGRTTSTGDTEGDVTSEHPVTASEHDIAIAAQAFVGEIEQTPPMHSALKRDGIPLYALARRGITVEREKRKVTVYALAIREINRPTVVFDVSCSKGTYIRTLAEDLGQRLGCGAHLTALRRTQVGPFAIDACVSLARLEAINPLERLGCLLEPAVLVSQLPALTVNDEVARRYRMGQVFECRDALPNGEVAVFDHARQLLGVGLLCHGEVRPVRSIATPA